METRGKLKLAPALHKLYWLILGTVCCCCCLMDLSQEFSLQPARVRERPESSQSEQDSLQKRQLNSKIPDQYNRLLGSYQTRGASNVAASNQQLQNQSSISLSSGVDDQYVCAPYCTCSMVQVMDRELLSSRLMATTERETNLSRVFCDSNQFTDLLTIDKQTQIIHISLPPNQSVVANNEENQSSVESSHDDDSEKQLFRMPRLSQFNRLREIIIIKLKFEVCDSEVFKKGQKLLRLRFNYNHLIRLSKSCLKHLNKLLELNLDHNILSELESALFSGLTNLRSLSIAHNRLSELAAHQFVNLSRLQTLNLIGNSFKTINLHLLEPTHASLRYLLLAKNQIKSFIYSPQQLQLQQQQQQSSRVLPSSSGANTTATNLLMKFSSQQQQQLLIGLTFKNLIKLNVDENKFERIKSLQLHRFYNVKFLSIRQNEIATIRDKAFNGLKLVELNLAHNQLQTISKCAFCNSTIKRIVLSNNNISLPQPPGVLQLEPPPIAPIAARQSSMSSEQQQQQQSNTIESTPSASPLLLTAPIQSDSMMMPPATSSQNMLILSQSIFGPLFSHLEYLDLSQNHQLASQLEFLLEPLLKLEYLNLASVGLELSLPSPTMFKNLRQLRYLNLSNNQLDQLISETIEPLTQLEVLDLSHNKFSELDESFLVTADEMSPLKLLNLGSNPWYCSQCKVAPLYDWILRSPIYNATCISPLIKQRDEPSSSMTATTTAPTSSSSSSSSDENDEESYQELRARNNLRVMIPLANNYFDNFDDIDLMNEETKQLTNSNYNLLSGIAASQTGDSASLLVRDSMITATDDEDEDKSIDETMALVTSMSSDGDSNVKNINFDPGEYCLKCEFPSELSAFHIHELAPGDFKFCAGAAPRFAASEPKIGLTLAIVIIGALFIIIIVVIVMYRKKSNTYYTNEDMDHLDASQPNGKKPVFSISSDNENNQYGDGTDYSSPPMSHSIESYSQEDEDLDEDEEYDDEEEDEDEDEEDEQDEEDDLNEAEDEDETLIDEDEEENDEDERKKDSSSNRSLNGSQRQSGGSTDSQQSRQALEEAKRQRRSQIEEYNKRNDANPMATAGELDHHEKTHKTHQQIPTQQPKFKTANSPESLISLASPSVQSGTHVDPHSSSGHGNGYAKANTNANANAIGPHATGMNPTIASHKLPQSSVDSVALGQLESVDNKRSHQPTLTRNQSNPQQQQQQQHQQQQKLTFAEHPSVDNDNTHSKSLLRGQHRKSRSKESSSEHKQPSLETTSRQMNTSSTKAIKNEERIPTMLPHGSNHEPVGQQQYQVDSSKQQQQQQQQQQRHSLDKSATRRKDKQSSTSNVDGRSTLRRHQTSKENPSSKWVQVPSQQSGGSQLQQFAQLQVHNLAQVVASGDHHGDSNSGSGSGNGSGSGKPERARHRFAISKELSQTLGGVSSGKPLWDSGDSQIGDVGQIKNGGHAVELRPPSSRQRATTNRPIELISSPGNTAVGDKAASRQMEPHLYDASPPSLATSDDATTADSLALEHPNAADDSDFEGLGGPIVESLNYSGGIERSDGGGALAMDSDSNSLLGADQGAPNRLKAAVSSHSALTQTGSSDLLD